MLCPSTRTRRRTVECRRDRASWGPTVPRCRGGEGPCSECRKSTGVFFFRNRVRWGWWYGAYCGRGGSGAGCGGGRRAGRGGRLRHDHPGPCAAGPGTAHEWEGRVRGGTAEPPLPCPEGLPAPCPVGAAGPHGLAQSETDGV